MVWRGVAALLGGTEEGARRLESLTLREILHATGNASADSLDRPVKELFEQVRSSRDELNQYSFPFGLPELRHAIADYTQTCHGYRPDPEEQITVVLGASEGMAAAFRSLLDPGDGVVVMQPYHELYPSQAAIFGLVPRFVTLREDRRAGTWRLDRDELRAALSHPSVKAVVVNTPQNPTGKVLDEEELGFIAELCRAYDRFAISDEIYEHITFDGHRHRCLARCEGMAERTLVVNSISKTGRATGWALRLGDHAAGALTGVARSMTTSWCTRPRRCRRERCHSCASRSRSSPASRRATARSVTCWSAACARSSLRRPRLRVRTTCSRTTATCWR